MTASCSEERELITAKEHHRQFDALRVVYHVSRGRTVVDSLCHCLTVLTLLDYLTLSVVSTVCQTGGVDCKFIFFYIERVNVVPLSI